MGFSPIKNRILAEAHFKVVLLFPALKSRAMTNHLKVKSFVRGHTKNPGSHHKRRVFYWVASPSR